MLYCLKLKNSNEIKTCVEAASLKAAIRYFSSLEHLCDEDLLRLFRIDQKKRQVRKRFSGTFGKRFH